MDDGDRRATITRAQQYHMVGKSRGIILTSEAKERFQVRSPYDVACLGFIFGLSEEQGRCSVSTLSKRVLLSAESRRFGKTPVLLKYEDVNTSTSEDESDDDEEEMDEMEIDQDEKEKGNKKRKESCSDVKSKNKRMKIS